MFCYVKNLSYHQSLKKKQTRLNSSIADSKIDRAASLDGFPTKRQMSVRSKNAESKAIEIFEVAKIKIFGNLKNFLKKIRILTF